MTKRVKLITAALCLACAAASFLYYIYAGRLSMDGLLAPIHVNIELDKTYSGSFELVNEPFGYTKGFRPTNSNTLEKIVIHAGITNEFAQGLSLRLPQEHSDAAIASIDSISIFTGNKLLYFDSSEIAGWKHTTNNGAAYYTIPAGIYKKSFIKNWINWYGDLNFILKGLIALITRPYNFIFVYIFLLAAFLLLSQEINTLLKKQKKSAEIALLVLLLIFGFLLRVDNLTRHSLWYDELYSAVIASNPNNPIINAVKDPGNPPFYFLVLRLWFTIFGWSEAAGRLLSVFIGTGAIITLYLFVKTLCGRKYALITAFLLTIGFSSIGFSFEMRGYILLILLAPLVSKVFMRVLEQQTFKSNCMYAILGALLVNTHYFGVLFIAGNFFFYFKHKRHTLTQRSVVNFITVNLIVALSLVPYFYITAFQAALMEKTFNASITKPGKWEYMFAILLPLIYIAGTIMAAMIKKQKLIERKKYFLLDYSCFTGMFVYLAAFFISLYRPVFRWRYMSICYPFVMIAAAAPFFVNYGVTFRIRFRNFSCTLPLITLALLFAVSGFITKLRIFGGGSGDVYKESQEYIVLDAKKYTSAAEIPLRHMRSSRQHDLYNLIPIPHYSKQNQYDVVYINPFDRAESRMNNELLQNGLNPDNVLRLHTERPDSFIYKVLMEH